MQTTGRVAPSPTARKLDQIVTSLKLTEEDMTRELRGDSQGKLKIKISKARWHLPNRSEEHIRAAYRTTLAAAREDVQSIAAHHRKPLDAKALESAMDRALKHVVLAKDAHSAPPAIELLSEVATLARTASTKSPTNLVADQLGKAPAEWRGASVVTTGAATAKR